MSMRVGQSNERHLLTSVYVMKEYAEHVARMQTVGAKPLKIGRFHYLIEEILTDDIMINLSLINQEHNSFKD